jgi:hypothetical protein
MIEKFRRRDWGMVTTRECSGRTRLDGAVGS